MYAREIDAKSQPGVKVFLIAAVLPGNPYPVTEHPLAVPFVTDESIGGDDKRRRNPLGLYGQALKAGYQSHYTVVDSVSMGTAFPTQLDDFDDPMKKRVVSDELVVFEGAQALPLFLVYYKSSTGNSGLGSTTGEAAVVASSVYDVELMRKEMYSGGSVESSSSAGDLQLILVCSSLGSFCLCFFS